MNWYALQVLTGTERDVCTALRRKGVKARAPDQRMEIRRRGQWQTEDRLLLPGDGFVGADGPLAAFAGCPVRMERRQRRAYVTAELGGVARRVRFGVIPVDGDAQ